MDDSVLLTRARRGDERAFSALFDRYERQVFRYAAYMCGPHAGDDVVQETFLCVLKQRDRDDRPQGSVIGYLLGIARHVVMKRSNAIHEAAMADAMDDSVSDCSPLDAMTKAETIATVREAIETLPAAYREAVVLCELQELDYDTVAVVMQCPIGTVRSRLHRGRRLLATKLSAMRNQGSPR